VEPTKSENITVTWRRLPVLLVLRFRLTGGKVTSCQTRHFDLYFSPNRDQIADVSSLRFWAIGRQRYRRLLDDDPRKAAF
jgi:hypothetical protein